MDDLERRLWYDCLKLWEYIANYQNDKDKFCSTADYKNYVLEKLGLRTHIKHGCPMCQAYLIADSCTDCPISLDNDEYIFACEKSTPYNEWSNSFPSDDDYNAEAFYKYLQSLAKRRGYEQKKS